MFICLYLCRLVVKAELLGALDTVDRYHLGNIIYIYALRLCYGGITFDLVFCVGNYYMPTSAVATHVVRRVWCSKPNPFD